MALVVVEEGANRGACFPVSEGETVLGRDLACGVPVYDERASRRHCAIRKVGTAFSLLDLGSRNGTLLNGLGLGQDPAALDAGDLVRIGSTVLRFEPALLLESGGETTLDPTATAPSPARRGEARQSDGLDFGREGGDLLVCESAPMRAVVGNVRQAAPSDALILLTGESGTGKELCARAIHAFSPRRREPFVPVNCAALPEALFESELFGHERGAFTGAEATRKGLFELAGRGTLFLDEIGELGPSLQAKLLRVLDSGEFRRVGGATFTSRARVIAATNRDLREMARRGEFREDLFYRLSVVTIALPPLRERPSDLPGLVRAILARLARERGGRVIDASPAALEALSRYDFPGNVRELRNALERALILGGGAAIEPDLLPPEIRTAQGSSRFGPLSLAEAERRHIARVLAELKGNKTQAAKALGVDRKTLYAKIEAYGLGPQVEKP